MIMIGQGNLWFYIVMFFYDKKKFASHSCKKSQNFSHKTKAFSCFFDYWWQFQTFHRSTYCHQTQHFHAVNTYKCMHSPGGTKRLTNCSQVGMYLPLFASS